MKESYKELELEVIRFEVEDIIATSCTYDEDITTPEICIQD